MTYQVLVHNNPPAYKGISKAKAQEAFDAEVQRTRDGIGPIETIELTQNGKAISVFEDGELTEPVPVIFRIFRDQHRDVIAIMPTQPGDSDLATCQSYMHIGQHSACDPLCLVSKTDLATPAEYADLKAELEGRGYILAVKDRITYEMFQKRQATVRRNRYDAIHNKD